MLWHTARVLKHEGAQDVRESLPACGKRCGGRAWYSWEWPWVEEAVKHEGAQEVGG